MLPTRLLTRLLLLKERSFQEAASSEQVTVRCQLERRSFSIFGGGSHFQFFLKLLKLIFTVVDRCTSEPTEKVALHASPLSLSSIPIIVVF